MPSKPYPSSCELRNFWRWNPRAVGHVLGRRHAAVHAIHCVLADEIYPSLHRIQIGPFAGKMKGYAIAVDLAGKRNHVPLLRRNPCIAPDLGTGIPFVVEGCIVAASPRKGAERVAKRRVRGPEREQFLI